MSKSKGVGRGKGGGPKTKYQAIFADQAFRLSLLLSTSTKANGSAEKELADFFEVSVVCLREWMKKHPKFASSIKRGKGAADGIVVDCLYQKATGFKHPDTIVQFHDGKWRMKKIIKVYPPDTASMIFWLKNRRPDMWREKHELGLTNPDGSKLSLPPLLVQLTADELPKAKQPAEPPAEAGQPPTEPPPP